MPADGDIIATLDGTRDVATVGAIAAQTDGVDPINTTTASDVNFQENAASGSWDAIPTTTENLPPATGNSFAPLTDTDDTPTLADNDDDILFRAIRVCLPEVAAVLVRQDNKIRALPEQVEPRMGPSMEE